MWKEINYETVPSVAMARYTNAFNRHDAERFEKYKEALVKGEAKVHSDALFPHDCVRTVMHGDDEIANAQFEALPNFLEGTNEKIIVIADTSASMGSIIGGSVEAVHVSIGMALYCSDKIGKDNPFYRKFIAFCSESEFKDWSGMTFAQAVRNEAIFDGAVGATRIDKALMSILKVAKFFNLKQEQMPTTLLIISDMQFTAAAYVPVRIEKGRTPVERCLAKFEEAGYIPPKIVYWNTAGYAGSPALAYKTKTALVSGFSPSILASIFSGEDLSPIAVMDRTLEKYIIIDPRTGEEI